MDLRHLNHAKLLAEEGSFAAAASKLGLTQPALSKSIQVLEAGAGMRLFDRSRLGVTPTAAGAALLRRADGLLDGMADLKAELTAMRDGRLGKVRIGLGPLPAKLALAPAMGRFAIGDTGIEISAEIGSAPDLALKIARGDLDFLIASLQLEKMLEGVELATVGLIPLAILARKNHPIFVDDSYDREEFHRLPILGGTIPEPPAGDRRGNSVGYHPLLSCDDYDVLARVALSSDALIVATPALIRLGWPYCELAPLPMPSFWPKDRRVAKLVLVTRKGKSMSPAAREVLEELRLHLDAVLDHST